MTAGRTNNNNNGSTTVARPSDARRAALQDEVENFSSVSNFFSIEKYYDLAQKVHESFQQALDTAASMPNNNSSTTKNGVVDPATHEALWMALDNAYVYGKRYCKFVVDGIAQHNYYGSPKYKPLQLKHTAQVAQTINQLTIVVDAMDRQELERLQLQAQIERQRQAEAAKREAQKYQELQKRALQFQTTEKKQQSQQQQPANDSVQASALSKLKLLGAATPSPGQEQVGTGRVRGAGDDNDRIIKRDPSGEEPNVTTTTTSGGTSRYRLPSSDSEEDDDDEEKKTNGSSSNKNLMAGMAAAAVLPPPVPPPSLSMGGSSAPPSYNQALATQRSGRYHRTFLGPQVTAPEDETGAHVRPTSGEPPKAKRRAPLKPMRDLKEDYRVAYIKAQEKRRIQVEGIDTYQGRVGQSTNGCTVISALVAARHLMGHTHAPVISDAMVCDVIDRQCGPLLREIRGKLGLGGHALIIPSDVHDHLVDKKLLEQELFEGAAGGNIMDPNHTDEFLRLLSDGDDGKGASRRAAATLFFREHVISIVKTPSPNAATAARYDLIDSLPSNLFGSGRARATRTICSGLAALRTLLQHYTSRKFSDPDCSYIDRNPWDDTMADCDPRVFQGFVWSQKK